MAETDLQNEIQIIEYENKYSKDFARLNYEWIEEYFAVEAQDREILDDPEKSVISRGGQIFFAFNGEEIYGTAALLDSGKESYELAKMAVSPRYRGLKIGDRLMSACIAYAERTGKQRIFLLSNTKLLPALKLYRKFGFVEIPLDSHTPYLRTDIQMELRLENKK